jgi:hypothetical protein
MWKPSWLIIFPVLERAETRPEPLSAVPFSHNPDFIAREPLLEQIHEKASIPGSRVVLVGLGGVGSDDPV